MRDQGGPKVTRSRYLVSWLSPWLEPVAVCSSHCPNLTNSAGTRYWESMDSRALNATSCGTTSVSVILRRSSAWLSKYFHFGLTEGRAFEATNSYQTCHGRAISTSAAERQPAIGHRSQFDRVDSASDAFVDITDICRNPQRHQPWRNVLYRVDPYLGNRVHEILG